MVNEYETKQFTNLDPQAHKYIYWNNTSQAFTPEDKLPHCLIVRY